MSIEIKSLTIENFKCFKTEKTFDFGRITVLTGANSSGKSSVISALLAILQSESEFPKNLSINGQYVNLGDFKEIAYKHNSDAVIKLNVKLKNNVSYSTSWQQSEQSLQPKLLQLEKTGRESPFASLFPTNGKLNYISAFRQSPQRTYLHRNLSKLKVDTEGGGYLDQIIAWEQVNADELVELVKIMSEIGLFYKVKTRILSGGRFEILVQTNKNGILTALSNVGYGISQFLPIIVADLQLENNSTLFLAEPEIHLHPSVQSKFGDYLVKQVNNSEKNYIIETHSEYLLNRLRLAIVKGELKKQDIKVYYLENDGEDTEVYDIDFTKTGAIKNAPDSFFETYSMDVMEIAYNAIPE